MEREIKIVSAARCDSAELIIMVNVKSPFLDNLKSHKY